METQGPRWLSLIAAATVYDVGTRTVGTDTPAYLAELVAAGRLDGRPVDVPVEIRSDAIEVLIERDLEAFVRRELDEDAS